MILYSPFHSVTLRYHFHVQFYENLTLEDLLLFVSYVSAPLNHSSSTPLRLFPFFPKLLQAELLKLLISVYSHCIPTFNRSLFRAMDQILYTAAENISQRVLFQFPYCRIAVLCLSFRLAYLNSTLIIGQQAVSLRLTCHS